jgi:hypothetical protein
VRVEGDKAQAIFEDGVLTLRIPKAEEVKPRQIRIQPGNGEAIETTADDGTQAS